MCFFGTLVLKRGGGGFGFRVEGLSGLGFRVWVLRLVPFVAFSCLAVGLVEFGLR